MIPPDFGLAFDERAHRYTLDGVQLPSVTTVLQHAGLVDYGFLNAEDRARCLERGRAVHVATEQDDAGELAEASVPPEIRGYLEAWRAFRWDYEFLPRLIEHRVCHRQYRYAGTLDRVGRVRDGTEVILDIKTGAAPDCVRLQLAAYNACLPHPRTRLRRCVELHPEGIYRVIGFETSDYTRDLNEFLRALKTFRNREEK